MGEKIENPELKPQIEAFAIEMLENCELFVNTYGRGYAKERLAINFKKLYTDESSKSARGQYSLGTLGIMTLFMKGSNGNKLTFEDIKRNGDSQTALHESVHAVFNKTPKECKEIGIRCGSGIHELYNNTEMGRGLNEGFTNWVCEKAGLHTMSYQTLTNLVKILEIAIGPENVMKFGYGNISKKLPKLLKMTPDECRTLLAKADSIYDYEDKSSDFSILASTIKRKADFETYKMNSPELTMDEELAQDLQGLYNNPIYMNILNNGDYIRYTQENNLKPELEGSKLSYFEHMKDFYFNKAKEKDQEIKGDIFSKYFMKELREIISTNKCSFEEYKKFAKLSSLIYIHGDFKNETLKAFKEDFETLRKQFYDKAEKDIREAVKNGSISVEKISQYRDATIDGNHFDPNDFNTMLSKIMLPENPAMYENLYRSLSSQNMVSELFNYRMFELRNQSGEKTNLFLNTKNDIHFTYYIYNPKVFSASEEIKDKDSLFDMTLNELQSMQEIVKNFLSLKEQICQKNPNTKLQIVDNVVVSQTEGEEPTFYLIDGNNWVTAQTKEFVPQNLQQSRSNPLQLDSIDTSAIPEYQNVNGNYPETITRNPFKRLFQEIRKRFFRSEPAIAVADTQLNQKVEKLENSETKINDRLRFTSDGKPITTPTVEKNGYKSDGKNISESENELTQ